MSVTACSYHNYLQVREENEIFAQQKSKYKAHDRKNGSFPLFVLPFSEKTGWKSVHDRAEMHKQLLKASCAFL